MKVLFQITLLIWVRIFKRFLSILCIGIATIQAFTEWRTPVCNDIVTPRHLFSFFPTSDSFPPCFCLKSRAHKFKTWEIFFFKPLKMLYQLNRKKIGVPWPLNIVFRSMNSKTRYFEAIFVFWGQISLWSRVGRAPKFYVMVVALIRNFHF